MGRTVPSWRRLLEDEFKRWKKFQESLRFDDREIFEDLMNECRRYASAAGAATFPTRTEGMFLSILFAQHKRLKELIDKLDHITKKVNHSN